MYIVQPANNNSTSKLFKFGFWYIYQIEWKKCHLEIATGCRLCRVAIFEFSFGNEPILECVVETFNHLRCEKWRNACFYAWFLLWNTFFCFYALGTAIRSVDPLFLGIKIKPNECRWFLLKLSDKTAKGKVKLNFIRVTINE